MKKQLLIHHINRIQYVDRFIGTKSIDENIENVKVLSYNVRLFN